MQIGDKANLLTRFDTDNSWNDFSISVGGPASEPWLVMEAAEATEFVKKEAVGILSEG